MTVVDRSREPGKAPSVFGIGSAPARPAIGLPPARPVSTFTAAADRVGLGLATTARVAARCTTTTWASSGSPKILVAVASAWTAGELAGTRLATPLDGVSCGQVRDGRHDRGDDPASDDRVPQADDRPRRTLWPARRWPPAASRSRQPARLRSDDFAPTTAPGDRSRGSDRRAGLASRSRHGGSPLPRIGGAETPAASKRRTAPRPKVAAPSAERAVPYLLYAPKSYSSSGIA